MLKYLFVFVLIFTPTLFAANEPADDPINFSNLEASHIKLLDEIQTLFLTQAQRDSLTAKTNNTSRDSLTAKTNNTSIEASPKIQKNKIIILENKDFSDTDKLPYKINIESN